MWAPDNTTMYATPIGVTLDAMTVGQTVEASLQFDTLQGRTTWLVRFDTSLYAASHYATVTRVSSTVWTFSADDTRVAVLVEPPTRKNPAGVMHGYYNMPFSFDIEKLP